MQSFAVVKNWWPACDTFQVGVEQTEKAKKSFRTQFVTEQDLGSVLNVFKAGKADAAAMTIYEAILAASEGKTLKIVLLLDYTTGSDGLVPDFRLDSVRAIQNRCALP